jgi:hypothetical protein
MPTILDNPTHHRITFDRPATPVPPAPSLGLGAWYFREVSAQLCELRIKARSRQPARLPRQG